ncbi:YopX protein [Streptococcus constellatus]|uniref:YopX protein n=1 Tax=Streptococcus constellatus TaxID=76860 RepID=A0A564U1W6_STRCV|nr:YopX family protein [Streptococcus constellatus]VUW99116.1 YopX protein [Streptococcus gordonii]VUX13477.1 YopX protein [Streptococcus constellatus]
MNPKFRAWLPISKWMCEVTVIDYDLRSVDICRIGDVEHYTEMTVSKDEVILVQSTGLKDKNSVEIFEGDILKYDSESGKVVYDPDRTMWRVYGKDFDDALSDWWIGRVIGNIYENPELMEGNA